MKIGDTVKITKCAVCPKVVGKVGRVVQTVTGADTCGGPPSVEVRFGRGRPQLNRPSVFGMDDVELVVKDEVVNVSE